MKYKGKYRIKPNLDKFTNDFPRTDDECIDPSYDDIYIKCANDSQIYHYGKSTLVAYIPSVGRGHNILIAIAKELNTSVQPIFYQFKNMNEVKEKLLNYAFDYYKKYLLNFNNRFIYINTINSTFVIA